MRVNADLNNGRKSEDCDNQDTQVQQITKLASGKKKEKEKKKHKKKGSSLPDEGKIDEDLVADMAEHHVRSQTHLGHRSTEAGSTTLHDVERQSQSSLGHYGSSEKTRCDNKAVARVLDRAGRFKEYENGKREDVLLANIMRRIDNGAGSKKYGGGRL